MKKNNLIAYSVIALLFGAMGAWVGTHQKEPAPPVTATVAPGATGPVDALYSQSLPDVAGASQALAQYKGQALLVNFWAPWCAPCVQEMPELSALAAGDAGKKLKVIGIGIDSPSNIAEFANKFKIAYPLYVAGMGGTELSRQFGNTGGGLPYTVLIGADGQVKKTYLGRLKFDQLRADLAAL
ncbi:TlpA family protein disulfide reductase [Duganella sp. FT3S]|uniref:TlpA family protein disulfide reductase n=1 Tax=Rugamonas fusca TaxID=2758568 RepID=A0A7W2EKM4_9BURK|nr:TlpA disulfide reductase family protein [Rugamonas fusca]MBA5607634.1 TlpA family protein disulfide reductase [Rugamonas fusca]